MGTAARPRPGRGSARKACERAPAAGGSSRVPPSVKPHLFDSHPNLLLPAKGREKEEEGGLFS